MTHAVLRVAKLKGRRIIVTAAKHNCREIAAERGAHSHIDASRIALNYAIRGGETSSAIVAQAAQRMATAGIDAARLRKDAVRGIEFLFSPSRDAQLDHRAFFTACTDWAAQRFGGADNLVSSIVHVDEALPHCHVLIVPISGGRMVGSDMLGAGAHFASVLQDFQEKVCVPYGLQPPPRKLWGAAKAALANAVIRALESNSDAALRSTLWQSIREAIEREPDPFALAYGVAMPMLAPAKPGKSLVEIMTGKGKRTAEDRNPIGFARPENHQTLSCVGFAISPALSLPPNKPHRARRYLLSESLQ
jgi:Plasmid recombination enzyme